MSEIWTHDMVNYVSNTQKKTGNFVWKKKIAKNLSRSCLDDFSVKAGKKRKRELKVEIENLKKKREERALRKVQRDKEMSVLARKSVHAESEDLEKKEREFQLQQFQIKSKIRLEQGRFKLIDVLRKRIEDHSVDFYREPYEVFRGLTVKELEEVRDDIRLHLEFDVDTPMRLAYWQSILVICDWELYDAGVERYGTKNTGKNTGLHSSIAEAVNELLQEKTQSQLQTLQSQIELQLQSGEAIFEAILRYLPLYKAKACLKEMSSYGCAKSNGATHHKEVEVILEGKSSDDEKAAPEYMEEGDVEALDSSHEFNIDSTACNDKFHVKKPKYYNRVHARYDWNRYNRTHFDRENPPPKIVQGYKFNIYYPDLVDKSIAPSYTIETDNYSGVETDGYSGEPCIIRFNAGQPYQDIAF